METTDFKPRWLAAGLFPNSIPIEKVADERFPKTLKQVNIRQPQNRANENRNAGRRYL